MCCGFGDKSASTNLSIHTMSSYWNNIVGINGKPEKHSTSPKYQKVSTQMTPIKQNKIKPPLFHKSLKSDHSLNNRNTTNTTLISDHHDSDSELDDDDFPDATEEHHSLINLNPKSKQFPKSNVRYICTFSYCFYLYIESNCPFSVYFINRFLPFCSLFSHIISP